MSELIKNLNKKNRTHAKVESLHEDCYLNIKKKIISRGDLPYASVEQQLDILRQLNEFPLGRFILERKGANGFWTDYMISHPQNGRLSGLNIEGKPFCPVEDYLLNRCPVVLAHQERFAIFQKLAQERIRENIVMASIPCGIMRDLLTLDLTSISNFKLIGIDIDEESLLGAKNLAGKLGINNVEFQQQDAWGLNYDNEIDIITSSGLNVYESDISKVLALYRLLFQALKPGGFLITSVLTYPPDEEIETDWILDGIAYDDILMNKILHKDILDIKWQNFRSSNDISREFEQVGFTEIAIYFDKHHIFPTILAKKPEIISD